VFPSAPCFKISLLSGSAGILIRLLMRAGSSTGLLLPVRANGSSPGRMCTLTCQRRVVAIDANRLGLPIRPGREKRHSRCTTTKTSLNWIQQLIFFPCSVKVVTSSECTAPNLRLGREIHVRRHCRKNSVHSTHFNNRLMRTNLEKEAQRKLGRCSIIARRMISRKKHCENLGLWFQFSRIRKDTHSKRHTAE